MPSDPSRFGNDKRTKEIVSSAIAGGWVWEGVDGRGHGVLSWPATGDRVSVASSPKVASWKSAATRIKNVSGVDVWRKGNRKVSRKADQVTGFDLDEAARESSKWHALWGQRVERLHEERDYLMSQCRELAKSRTRIREIPRHLARIEAIEECLATDFHQPVEPFDPLSLAPQDEPKPKPKPAPEPEPEPAPKPRRRRASRVVTTWMEDDD